MLLFSMQFRWMENQHNFDILFCSVFERQKILVALISFFLYKFRDENLLHIPGIMWMQCHSLTHFLSNYILQSKYLKNLPKCSGSNINLKKLLRCFCVRYVFYFVLMSLKKVLQNHITGHT